MPEITAVRVRSNHDFRAVFSNQAHDFLPELGGVFQSLVFMAQKDDFSHPEQIGGALLLPLSNFSQPFRFHIDITGAFIAVSADNVNNVFTFFHPLGDRTGDTKFSVIRMGCNHHYLRLLNRHANLLTFL
jgi:hypothetical protein